MSDPWSCASSHAKSVSHDVTRSTISQYRQLSDDVIDRILVLLLPLQVFVTRVESNGDKLDDVTRESITVYGRM